MHIIVPKEALERAINAVSADPTRFYLQGVFIERTASGFHVVATDGHILYFRHVQRITAPDPEAPRAFEPLIIPTETVKAALKLAHRQDEELLLETEAVRFILGGVTFSPVDGTFPDWRLTVPAETSGEPAVFAPAVWSRAFAALGIKKRDAGLGGVNVRMNGRGPAVLTDGQDTVLVMPVRAEEAHEKAETPKVISAK